MDFGVLQIEEPVIPQETTVFYLQELKFQLCNLIKRWREMKFYQEPFGLR